MKRMLNALYWIGDSVYHRMTVEKSKGIVTGITIRPNNVLLYAVTWGSRTESCHYEFELTSEYVPEYVDEQGPNEAGNSTNTGAANDAAT